MFFKSKSSKVPALLAEGINWVENLEAAALDTTEEAMRLETESRLIAEKAAETRSVAEEGHTVAANFRKMLTGK